MVLDGVTSSLRLKKLHIHVNVCHTVQLLDDFFSATAESWKKLRTSNVFLSFIVCKNRNRSAVVRELLNNNSLFVGQLYEDKSLVLCAHDLIFFTTDLQTVNNYTTIHC